MSRLAIIALIITLVLLLLRWFLKPSDQEGSSQNSTEMVRDPNCGIYIPKPEAVKKNVSGEELFFCSVKCANEYNNR